MKIIEKYINLLCCPNCGGDLILENKQLYCKICGAFFKIINGIPILLPRKLPKEQLVAINTWRWEYRKLLESKKFDFIDKYSLSDLSLVKNIHCFDKERGVFLELGCGRGRVSIALLKNGYRNVIGVDISFDAVKLAKKICDENNITNYLFIVGDIYNLPIKNNKINLIFAGGSIEHFEDTIGGLSKIYSILNKQGIFIATIPYASLATLFQAFLTGSIPRIPILMSFYKWFHFSVMKNRNLMYGFEYSFTISELKRMSKEVGYTDFNYGFYDVEYDLKFVPELLKNIIQKIIRLRFFWPMIFIKLKK